MKTWVAGCALIGAFAVTGCGGAAPSAGDPPSVSGDAQGASPSGSGGDAAASSNPSGAASSEATSTEASQPGATQTGTTASPDSSEATYELTKTYTDPDGLFTVKYPESWKAQENRGYLELSNPDGKVKGNVASTATRAPRGEWFTRPIHPLIGDETELSKQLREKVSTYSTYVPAPPRSDKADSVLWGLTEGDKRGIVSIPGGGKRNELWAEFYYSPVNEGHRPLPQREGVELVNQINQTEDAGTVDAILKSIRVGG